MRNLFIIYALVGLLITSCEKNAGQLESLHSINIRDAKSIFQKSSGTKSGGETYWKIDENGKESKLVLFDIEGNASEANITMLQKLSDEFLAINVFTGYSNDIFFVNTDSERIFKLPQDIDQNIFSAIWDFLSQYKDAYSESFEYKTFKDKNGMIYMSSSYHDNNGKRHNQILKLDTNNFTLSFALPENQMFSNYHVTPDGFIWYSGKVQCPGGRIYPLASSSFIFNNQIYTSQDKKICRWKVINDNTLEKEVVCDFYYSYSFDELSGQAAQVDQVVSDFLENHVKKTVLLSCNGGFEFDGINTPLPILDRFLFYKGHGYSRAITKDAIFTFSTFGSNQELSRIDLATYQTSNPPISGYEIHEISSSLKSPNLTFSGISFSNGKNIIGTITSTGEIKIDFSLDDGNKIANLVEIF